MDTPNVVSSLKKIKLLIYITAWTHLKVIKISQSQKVTSYLIPFIGHSQIEETIENREQSNNRCYRFREDIITKG